MVEDRTTPEHGQDQPKRRLTVSHAAQELGISAEAVRSRIKRGTLESTKEGSTVYALLPGHPHADQTTPERGRTNDQTPPEHARAGAQTDLVDSLLDQVAYMREQLAEEREARRRADTIIAQLSQANAALARRVPEIEAPEATGAPETRLGDSEEPYSTHAPPKPMTPVQRLSERVEEAMDRGDTPPDGPGQQHPVERPSWWRKFFGLE